MTKALGSRAESIVTNCIFATASKYYREDGIPSAGFYQRDFIDRVLPFLTTL